jgi:hypothetical protein
LGEHWGHPLWAALISLVISAIVVIAALLILKVQACSYRRS